MKIKTALIFDLDNTLCDWAAAQHHAKLKINAILLKNEINVAFFWQRFAEINGRGLWVSALKESDCALQ